MADRRRLGDCTIEELLRSARNDLGGLADLARKLAAGCEVPDAKLYIGAYEGSISARLAVAEIKSKEA